MASVPQQGHTGGQTVVDKRVDLTNDALGRFDTIAGLLSNSHVVATIDYTYDNSGSQASRTPTAAAPASRATPVTTRRAATATPLRWFLPRPLASVPQGIGHRGSRLHRILQRPLGL